MSNRSRENQEPEVRYRFRNCAHELPISYREPIMSRNGVPKITPRKKSEQRSDRQSTSKKGRIIKKVIIYREKFLPNKRLEHSKECQHHSADESSAHN